VQSGKSAFREVPFVPDSAIHHHEGAARVTCLMGQGVSHLKKNGCYLLLSVCFHSGAHSLTVKCVLIVFPSFFYQDQRIQEKGINLPCICACFPSLQLNYFLGEKDIRVY
jgi:hypothetical protein